MGGLLERLKKAHKGLNKGLKKFNIFLATGKNLCKDFHKKTISCGEVIMFPQSNAISHTLIP